MGNNTLFTTIKSFGHLFYTMQSAGPDPWRLLLKKGKDLLACTWNPRYTLCWRCQTHRSSNPSTGECRQPSGIISEPCAAAKQKKTFSEPQYWRGHSSRGSELLKPHSSHSRAACGLLPNSTLFCLSKHVLLQPGHFTHHAAHKIKLFCGFYLVFLLVKPFLLNWGLLHLPLVYDAGSALD